MREQGVRQQQDYYDALWAEEKALNALERARLAKILEGIECLDLEQPRSLDLGCGRGWLTAVLGLLGPATGIDLSAQAVAGAQRRHPGCRFVAGDAVSGGTLAGEEGRFDLVVSQEVLEHVTDQALYVARAAAFLRPGGGLILTTPNRRNLAFWTEAEKASASWQPVENWLTRREVRALLGVDFEIVRHQTLTWGYGQRGIFAWLHGSRWRSFLRRVGCENAWGSMMLRLGWGLHQVVFARRR